MFYFPLFTCTNINSQKRNFSIRMRMYACRGVCLCPDLVIMAALYLERALSPCHRPSPIWHQMRVQTMVTGPLLVLCWYFIPHFTSSDFTMHKQSEFKERSLVMHWPLHPNPAGHTCALHSCNPKSPRWFCCVLMIHLSEFFQQTDK